MDVKVGQFFYRILEGRWMQTKGLARHKDSEDGGWCIFSRCCPSSQCRMFYRRGQVVRVRGRAVEALIVAGAQVDGRRAKRATGTRSSIGLGKNP